MLVAATPATARQVLVLNNPTDPPLTNDVGSGFLDRVVGEAFRRSGVELRLVKLPAERGLRNANAGIEDGDLSRIAGLERAYPNLVRVPEKLLDMHFSAFSRRIAVRTDSWVALKPYSVGIIKGWKIFEENLRGITAPTDADNAEQLFTLLEKDRVDVVLYARWMGLALIERRKIVDARLLVPSLATREMFIYVHKKHAALVLKIAAALRALKADGSYQRIYDQTLAPLAVH